MKPDEIDEKSLCINAWKGALWMVVGGLAIIGALCLIRG